MAWLWNTGAVAKPTGVEAWADLSVRLINGIQTAASHYSGSADPQSGALTAWTSADLGTEWEDTTDPDNPVRKVYGTTTGSTTYGWITARIPKLLWPSSNVAVVAATTTGVDIAYGSPTTLSTILNASVQDASQTRRLVKSVTLIVRCRFTTSTHPGGDVLWIKLKNYGGGNERQVYCPSAVNVWTEQEVEMLLDSTERFDYSVDTNGGGNTVAYQISLKRGAESR